MLANWGMDGEVGGPRSQTPSFHFVEPGVTVDPNNSSVRRLPTVAELEAW